MIREVLLFLFYDLRQLFRNVCLDVFDEELCHVHFLIHDGDAAIIAEACRYEGREQNLLQLLVHKVCERQVAQLLQD